MTTNERLFVLVLTGKYRELFETDPDYAYSRARLSPEALAAKMTEGLRTGSANKDGKGIQRTCKALGIKYTYTAIKAYLNG